VTRWARKSIVHRALYYALHIPFVEPFLALLFPFYFKVSIKNRLRPYAIVHRARDTVRRLKDRRAEFDLVARLKTSVVGAAARLALRGIRSAKRHAQPLVASAQRVLGLIQRDGLRLALRKVRVQAIGSSSVREIVARLAVRPADLERLNQIRNYRALHAVEMVLVDYETTMRGGPFRSMPLVYLRRLLRQHKLDGARGSTAARTLLMKLVQKHPSWAEPWLELAFVYEDEGAYAEALRCFERAMRGKRAADFAPGEPHPSAVAAANRGRLLTAMGRNDDARAAFAFALARDCGQKMAAAQYAELLRCRGDIDNALVYYGEAMYHQECRWVLPSAPRDAADVNLRALTAEVLADLPVRSVPASVFAAPMTAERT